MAIPKPKVFWPLTIDATNCKVYMQHGGVDYNCSIASGTYYSALDLVNAMVLAMRAADASGNYGGTVGADGNITISAIVPFVFRWGTFLTNSAANTLGWFSVDTASAQSQVAPFQHANGWYSPTAVRSLTPELSEEPNSVITVTMGGQSKAISETELVYREVEFAYLPPERTLLSAEGGSSVNRSAYRWWKYGRGRFRFWPDASVEGTSFDYFLDSSVLTNGFKPTRMYNNLERYTLGVWRMRKFVA